MVQCPQLIVTLLLQLLQSIIGMVDECKSAVKSLRQQWQLTTLRSVDLQADINQRAGSLACLGLFGYFFA